VLLLTHMVRVTGRQHRPPACGVQELEGPRRAGGVEAAQRGLGLEGEELQGARRGTGPLPPGAQHARGGREATQQAQEYCKGSASSLNSTCSTVQWYLKLASERSTRTVSGTGEHCPLRPWYGQYSTFQGEEYRTKSGVAPRSPVLKHTPLHPGSYTPQSVGTK